MGISQDARTVTAILNNLSELSLPELTQEFPTVRWEQITGLLDFIAHSTECRP